MPKRRRPVADFDSLLGSRTHARVLSPSPAEARPPGPFSDSKPDSWWQAGVAFRRYGTRCTRPTGCKRQFVQAVVALGKRRLSRHSRYPY